MLNLLVIDGHRADTNDLILQSGGRPQSELLTRVLDEMDDVSAIAATFRP